MRLRLGPPPQLNELRAQIVDTDLRLTATSALLLAKQAAASALQREIKEKEQQVRSALYGPGIYRSFIPDVHIFHPSTHFQFELFLTSGSQVLLELLLVVMVHRQGHILDWSPLLTSLALTDAD